MLDPLVRSLGMGRCLEWGAMEARGQSGGILGQPGAGPY